MANKKSPGLPPGFDLHIPKQDEPVKLGDYLDEVAAPAPPRLQPQRRADESNVIELVRKSEDKPENNKIEVLAEVEPTPKVTPQKTRRRKRKGPARKQINASPEALKMIEELIEHVQTYSVQKDAKASEVFYGLVLTLYEAREFIDLSEVPARGRWGTPTAKSFPISLKNSFQEAIVAAYKKQRR